MPSFLSFLPWPQVDDERVFPQSFGAPFPPNFLAVVQTIYKRLFRVYGHIYHSHFKQVRVQRACRPCLLSLCGWHSFVGILARVNQRACLLALLRCPCGTRCLCAGKGCMTSMGAAQAAADSNGAVPVSFLQALSHRSARAPCRLPALFKHLG